MTALAADRNTARRTGRAFRDPVAAGVLIFAGSLVVLDASGDAKPAVTATGLMARGRAEHRVDNRLGQAGDLFVDVQAGLFGFASDGALTRADIGKVVYLVDDQTVSATATSRSAAGILDDLEGSIAWVSVGEPERLVLPAGAVGPTELAAGAVTLAKLAAGVTPTHRVIAAGIHPWAGGAAVTDSIAVVGLEATDIVLATLVARAAAETLVMAVNDAANDQIDLTLSANGTDTTTKVSYSVLRAVS